MSKARGTLQGPHKKRQIGRDQSRNTTLTCDPHDLVIHKGAKVWVSQVVAPGREKSESKHCERDFITVCRIMSDNGEILTRSPITIGQDWEHCEPRERREIAKPKKKSDHVLGINDKVYGITSGRSGMRGGAE